MSTPPSTVATPLQITQPINIAGAAIGDPLKAKLTSDLKDSNNSVFIPKGTRVVARIAQFERSFLSNHESLRLGIKTEGIEIQGVIRPFVATLDSIKQSAPGTLDLGTFDQMRQTLPDVGVLRFETFAEISSSPRG